MDIVNKGVMPALVRFEQDTVVVKYDGTRFQHVTQKNITLNIHIFIISSFPLMFWTPVDCNRSCKEKLQVSGLTVYNHKKLNTGTVTCFSEHDNCSLQSRHWVASLILSSRTRTQVLR